MWKLFVSQSLLCTQEVLLYAVSYDDSPRRYNINLEVSLFGSFGLQKSTGPQFGLPVCGGRAICWPPRMAAIFWIYQTTEYFQIDWFFYSLQGVDGFFQKEAKSKGKWAKEKWRLAVKWTVEFYQKEKDDLQLVWNGIQNLDEQSSDRGKSSTARIQSKTFISMPSMHAEVKDRR